MSFRELPLKTQITQGLRDHQFSAQIGKGQD